MADDIVFDDKEFQNRIKEYQVAVDRGNSRAFFEIASEILRLSSFEVPHDTGMLQNSGFVDDLGDEAVVGYNKVYAARLHEHPEYQFQDGRKAKYLEDPIKNNIDKLLQVYGMKLEGEIS